ncbi:non-ribosomal peptide synthetase [Acidisarcina polymorpha]|nr:non-ribosomal peptide synthetase [Acidisarcina polymorpha]
MNYMGDLDPALREHLPATATQKGLWFSEKYHAQGGENSVAQILMIHGSVDVQAFSQAYGLLIEAAPALRSTFAFVDGDVRQTVHPPSLDSLLIVDLSTHPDARAEMRGWIDGDMKRKTQVDRPYLYSTALFHLGNSEYAWYMRAHHLLIDGYGGTLVTRRVVELYASLVRGQTPALDLIGPAEILAMDVAYGDSEQKRKDGAFWQSELEGFGSTTTLALSGGTSSPDFRRQRIHLDAGVEARLRALAAQRGVDVPHIVFAIIAAYLYRLTGAEDVLLGLPVKARIGREARDAIGSFANIVPLRLAVDPANTISQLSSRAASKVKRVLRHQRYRLEDIERHYRSKNGGETLCRVTVSYSAFEYDFSLDQIPASLEIISVGLVEDLGVEIFDFGPESPFSVEMNFNEGLYSAAESALHARRFSAFCRQCIEQPDLPVDAIPLLPQEEREQLLEKWNQTEVSYPSHLCVHQLFELQALRVPDAPALKQNDTELTYRELNVRANHLAHHLSLLGVGPDRCIAVCMERSPALIVALLAVLKAGGAYVPLETRYPIKRLQAILQDCEPVAIIVDQSTRESIRAATVRGEMVLDLGADVGLWAAENDYHPKPHVEGLTSRNLAYIIYTSGTTGQPKGVMIEHRSVVNQIEALRATYGITNSDRLLQFASVAFDMSVEEIFGALLSGACLVLRSEEWLASTQAFLSRCEQVGITMLNLPPVFWQQLLQSSGSRMPACIRQIAIGGDAVSSQALTTWFAHPEPRPRLYNAYGPTEATVNATVAELRPENVRHVSIGKPLWNTRVYVLDEQKEPVPIGVTGELYLGGAGIARGYHHLPEENAERFLANPFVSGDRLYRTGDLVRYLPDSSLEYLGRSDYQIKVRGFRIEAGEIEARLAEYPGIRDSVVVTADRQDGSDKQLVAYYTLTDDNSYAEPILPAALRAYLTISLPEYMVPAAYVHLRQLPLTSNGKLDRNALPIASQDAYAQRVYEEPRGLLETSLAAVWSELFVLDRIGRNDNFFELGGDSIRVLHLLSIVRQRMGRELGFAKVFSHPVLSQLAKELEGASEQHIVPLNSIGEGPIEPWMVPLAQVSQEEIEKIVAGTPGGDANIQDIYALSPLQEGIFFHHLSSPDSDPYVSRVILSFRDSELVNQFILALKFCCERHDSLRTIVLWKGLRSPVQVVLRQADLKVQEIDLNIDRGSVVAQLQQRFDPQHYHFDISNAPLLRVFLAYDPSESRWIVLVLEHHLLLDHVSVEVLTEEIAAHMSNTATNLPAPGQFRNHIAHVTSGTSQKKHAEFFRELLAGTKGATYPYGIPHSEVDHAWKQANLCLDVSLSRAIRDTAKTFQVSPASLFHFAYGVVVGQLSGIDDAIFGTVLLGRSASWSGIERTLGLFVNTLPMRVRLSRGSVESELRYVHQTLTNLIQHEDAPLSLAKRASQLDTSMPLFSALLNYRHNSGRENAIKIDDLIDGVATLRADEWTNYPISINVDDWHEGFSLTAQVTADIDPSRLCGYLEHALKELVEALQKTPHVPPSRIQILPSAEAHQTLVAFNKTAHPYSALQRIETLFEAQAAHTPNREAVVFQGQRVTYDALNTQANILAHALLVAGVKPGAYLAMYLDRSVSMLVALLATMKVGATYIPLDPTHPAHRIEWVLTDSCPVAILTNTSLAPSIASLDGCPRLILVDNAEMEDTPETRQNPSAPMRTADMVAYILYTSGSTGRPKGVMIEHRSVVNLLQCFAERLALSPADRWLATTTITFDIAGLELYLPLISGACVVLCPTEVAGDATQLARLLRREPVTIMQATPTAWKQLIAVGWLPPPRLKVLSGGEELERSLAETLTASGNEVWNLYGPTETTIWSTAEQLQLGSKEVSIGSPLWNTQLFILDEHGKPAPVGVEGDLFIAGAGVARGYLNRPELNEERFLPHAFSTEPGARMYRTGDRAVWLENGKVIYRGRNDNQVKIRGFRIELGEIEARLAEHPDVREAAVIARESKSGDLHLLAYFVPVSDSTPSSEVLRAHLSAYLPAYMVPAAYTVMAAFPTTPNGKLDRRALPDPGEQAYSRHAYEAPQGNTEILLAEIWTELLNVEKIGRHDNFFDLGGDSRLAVQFVLRTGKSFSRELTLKTFFDRPLLRDVALLLDENTPSPIISHPVPLSVRDPQYPLSHFQLTYWKIHRDFPTAPINIGGAILLQGNLSLRALQMAVHDLAERHPALKTRFINRQQGEEPLAEVMFNWTPKIRIEDVEESLVQECLRSQLSTVFDLNATPPVDMLLLRLNPTRHILSLCMDNILVDGWSRTLLTQDLQYLYEAHLAGTSPALSAPALQYSDYAIWQRTNPFSDDYAYWQQQLQSVQQPRPLRPHMPNDAVFPYKTSSIRQMVMQDLYEKLSSVAVRSNASLFMLLVSGLGLVMRNYTSQPDFCLATITSGRTHHSMEHVVGGFVNVLPLHARLEESMSASESVAAVRGSIIDALTHGGMPYPYRLVEERLGTRTMPVWVRMQNHPQEISETWAGDLRVSPVMQQQDHSPRQPMQLDIFFSEEGGELFVTIHYAKELFDSQFMTTFVANLENRLAWLVNEIS